MNLLKGYQELLAFMVYAYCFMDNHCHFIIDVNGADISKIFHGLNQRYSHYFNRKYKRHGHLFQDRFKSIIVNNDEYLITLSGYIHANPLSMVKCSDRIEEHEYSSLGIYLGLRKDRFELVDRNFIMGQFSSYDVNIRRLYLGENEILNIFME